MFLALILPGPGARPPAAGGLRGCHKANTGQTESISPINCQSEPPSPGARKDLFFRMVMPGGVWREIEERSPKPTTTTTRPWQQTPLPALGCAVATPPLESHLSGFVSAFKIRGEGVVGHG
ncbi:hypothetical protein LY76DRAFT_591518 [Colletotrichum caudatum]|nr:hypothetical protein LY76DRAFT_591518 [Colletotrichum caudatum]